MKAALVLALAILFASPAPIRSWAAEGAGLTGTACVIDGDSIVVGGKRNKSGWCRGGVEVRISGIDAPEWDQVCQDGKGEDWPCGRAAKEAVQGMTAGKTVTCQVITRDKYKRAVSVCLAAGKDVGRELVARGLALAYRRYSKRYVEVEAAAKAEKRGIWAGAFMPPAEWRRNN